MKKGQSKKTRPQLARSDFDFSYVADLPRHLQQMAAFWEYARESEVIKESTRRVRRLTKKQLREMATVFLKEARKLKPSRKSKMVGGVDFTMEELAYVHLSDLSGTDGVGLNESFLLRPSLLGYFPDLSFKELLDRNYFRTDDDPRFGIGGLDLYPLKLPASGDIGDRSWPRGYYVARIDWAHTNEQLAQSLKARLKQLRPTDRPERKRPGRHGAFSDVAPVEMLNQLSALRLNRAGFNVKDVEELIPYTEPMKTYQSGAGWRKAINAAQDRIDRMLTQPFFGKISS